MLLAALALSATACRELTAPTQPNPAMILAQGLLLGPRNVPAANLQVNLIHQASASGDSFSLSITSDSQGRFEAWVPNVPLLVQVRPPSKSTLPNLDEENVRFERGVTRTFDLLGDLYRGVVGPARLDSLLDGAVLYMRTHVQRADGGQDGLSASTLLLPDGSFELHLPQAGRYEVYIDRCCTNAFRYYWPDSLEVSPGTPLHLEVPLVQWQLSLSLKGQPVPSGAIRCRIVEESDSFDENRTWQTIYPDGSTLQFAMYALRGGNRLQLDPWDQPVPALPIFPGLLNYVTPYLRLPPMDDGVELSLELGQYELQVLVLDPGGAPVSLADLYLYDDSGSGLYCYLNSDEEGKANFSVNPHGFELRVHKEGYIYVYRYFDLSGDMQMTVTLQPNPDEN